MFVPSVEMGNGKESGWGKWKGKLDPVVALTSARKSGRLPLRWRNDKWPFNSAESLSV